MSAVLLRRLFSSTVELYETLNPIIQQSTKLELLKGIQEEQSLNVKWKICDAVAEIARCLLGTVHDTVLYTLYLYVCCC